MTEKPTTTASPDSWLPRFREIVAASLAGMVVVGTIILIGFALSNLSTSESFDRIKDLLLFLNPLLGYVIGYYFNKASTEARAESAEATALNATAAAQESTQARNQAEAEASKAQAEAKEAKATLEDVSEAASKVLGEVRPQRVGTLAGDEDQEEDATTDLQAALARARLVLGK